MPRQQLGVRPVVAQQPPAFEYLPQYGLRRVIQIHNIDRAAECQADGFHEFEFLRARQRRVAQQRQIHVTVGAAIAAGLRTEQDGQPDSGYRPGIRFNRSSIARMHALWPEIVPGSNQGLSMTLFPG